MNRGPRTNKRSAPDHREPLLTTHLCYTSNGAGAGDQYVAFSGFDSPAQGRVLILINEVRVFEVDPAIANVASRQQRYTEVRPPWRLVLTIRDAFSDIADSRFHQAVLICANGSEHPLEDRLSESVEVGEDLAALGAEGVGLIEDRRDPPLLADRGKRDLDLS